jgi:hypothetical protein
MKIKVLLSAITFVVFGKTSAQQVSTKIVENDLTTMHNLQVRPNLGVALPYLPVNNARKIMALNIDAQYWLGTVADFRASIMIGGFTGVSLGATYHVKDKIAPTKQKFVLSRSSNGKTNTTTFVKLKPDSRNIFGPCADLNIGFFKGTGFATRLDVGLDFQSFSRAIAVIDDSRYASSRNGWFSLKIAGCFTNINYGDPANNIPSKFIFGFGGLANLNAVTRPWKKVCLSTGIQMGAIKAIGLNTTPSVVKQDSVFPIFAFNIGVSINLK